ncbi:PREDICTED: putative uncharacterized protein ASB16-AS1-like [Chrysochloris asiatica]|uniref:Uncharacterized protein n=1 Tax=Chrysochloris asiatica TaxID=185453 RepID=A0A9B0U2N6_CHRAS|nr:PREDICTED: putative uncharacterized protein ASB16-AS1-like [Chrysochloris asiatica]
MEKAGMLAQYLGWDCVDLSPQQVPLSRGSASTCEAPSPPPSNCSNHLSAHLAATQVAAHGRYGTRQPTSRRAWPSGSCPCLSDPAKRGKGRGPQAVPGRGPEIAESPHEEWLWPRAQAACIIGARPPVNKRSSPGAVRIKALLKRHKEPTPLARQLEPEQGALRAPSTRSPAAHARSPTPLCPRARSPTPLCPRARPTPLTSRLLSAILEACDVRAARSPLTHI